MRRKIVYARHVRFLLSGDLSHYPTNISSMHFVMVKVVFNYILSTPTLATTQPREREERGREREGRGGAIALAQLVVVYSG